MHTTTLNPYPQEAAGLQMKFPPHVPMRTFHVDFCPIIAPVKPVDRDIGVLHRELLIFEGQDPASTGDLLLPGPQEHVEQWPCMGIGPLLTYFRGVLGTATLFLSRNPKP